MMCLMEKSPGASLHPRGVSFHSTSAGGVTSDVSTRGGAILNPLPLPLPLPSALRNN